MKTKQASMAQRIGLLLLAVMVLFNGYTLAKYLLEKDGKVAVVAKNFYFESDLLAVSTDATPHYTLQAGVDTISFNLMNYPDELRVSEVNIAYKVTLTGGTENRTQKGTIETVTDQGYKRISTMITFDDLDPGTYTVTAEATSPYTQTLQGQFTIVGTNNDLSYTVSDASGSPNLKVTVTTTDYSGNIIISWPADVLPDNTDPLLSGASGQNCTIAVQANSEYTFQFFKTTPSGDYTNDITVVTENS